MKSTLAFTAMLVALVAVASVPFSARAAVDAGGIEDLDDSASIMDGVSIDALEFYPLSRRNDISFQAGIYPFDQYTTAFALGGAYTYAFSRTIAWEVFNINYLFTIDKDIRAELANRFQLQPEEIDRPEFLGSTNLIFYHSYGKFIFFDDVIRYFRVGLILGGGLFKTSGNSIYTGNLGIRFDLYVSSSFSWKIDVRDYIGVNNNYANYVVFSLNGSFTF